MNNDIITVYNQNGEKEDYKLLMIINKDYKYLIYTDLINFDINRRLHAVKVKELTNNEEVLPIDEKEWEMIESTYNELVSN